MNTEPLYMHKVLRLVKDHFFPEKPRLCNKVKVNGKAVQFTISALSPEILDKMQMFKQKHPDIYQWVKPSGGRSLTIRFETSPILGLEA